MSPDSVRPMSGEPAVRVSNLSKRFRLFHDRNQSLKQTLLSGRRSRHEDFWALRDVSFDVQRGETFGIVGHNGSGKSTLLKCLTKILQPDEGRVAVQGSISALLELGAGFHPELSGRENVFLNAAILGVPRRDIVERFDEIVEFSGLEQFIDTPVKNYSSGMFVRLGFAVAINVDPDVLIIDEVLAVGDAAFQAKCGDKIAEFRDRGKTIVLVTHGMSDVVRICQRAAWLDHGQLRMLGAPDEIVDAYMETSHQERTLLTDLGSRWGTGEVRIADVGLADATGAPLQFGQTGQPIEIRLRLTSEQWIDEPEVMVEFHDQSGNLVSQISTRRRAVPLGPIDGERHLNLRIEHLPLNEGTYELTFAVRDGSGQREYDVRSKFVRFDVLRGDHADGGLVTLGGEWSIPT
jgi:ABC-2 type transport system ATP-binding protein